MERQRARDPQHQDDWRLGIRAVELPANPSAHPTIRVLVVDDHAVLRQELIRILQREPDIEIVGEAADGKLAVDLVGQLRPDVVTMDISMPVMNGIEATRQIRAAWPAVHVIGLSMFNGIEYASVMEEAGAVDYLVKGCAADLLAAAVREAKNSNASPDSSQRIREQSGLPDHWPLPPAAG